MSHLFTPTRIGNMELPNRLVRSATVEHMVDSQGRSQPSLKQLYQELAGGGAGPNRRRYPGCPES